MFVHYRTQGFIFKKEDRGEADQLFTIYTKDFGKLEILGKAIRKISSKLRSGADIFYLSEIEFIQGKTHKTLTDAIPVEKFENLKKNLKRLQIAYRILEVLDNLVKGQESDEKIWQLLNETFQRLNSLEIRLQPTHHPPKRHLWKLEIIYHYFLWNLLSILGYRPELYHCAICQKNLRPEKLYLDSKEGGIICQNCFKKSGAPSRSEKEIGPEVIKILRIILEKNWQTLFKLKIDKIYLKSLESISRGYLSYISGIIK